MASYKEISDKKVHCLECGTPLAWGSRSDKKFCCDQCKYTYHNRNRVYRHQCKTKVNNILERNYKILSDLVKMEIDQIPVAQAVSMGFSPSFGTSFAHIGTYIEYTCYDIAYRASATKIFNIHRMSLTLRKDK